MLNVVSRAALFTSSLAIALCTFPLLVSASHIIAVEIRAQPLDCSARYYEITLIGYINTASGVAFGGESDVLSFGDGTSVIVPELPYTIVDPDRSVGMVRYTIRHGYQEDGQYILSYREQNRNVGIINMDDSDLTVFYTESSFQIDEDHCDTSPYMTVPPSDRACRGIAYFHNPGAFDADDDSLSFSFVVPQREIDAEVKGYRFPHDMQYYNAAGIEYNQANEAGDSPPSFIIDPVDGTITWDAPGAVGEYSLAIKVTSWRYSTDLRQWHPTGFTIRDMQVLVEECSNQKPDMIVPDEICVIAGEFIDFQIPATDPDGHTVKIEAFSEVFSLTDSPAEIFPGGGPFQSTLAPHDTASARFQWKTSCLHVKTYPYNVVFKITDSPPAGPALIRFKTVAVRIVAPAPDIQAVSVNTITKSITLQWKNDCENISSVQVWRRIAKVPYEAPDCSVGIPDSLKYTLYASLPGNAVSFEDSDIAHGVQYCYRILALVGERHVPSLLSADTCLIPKPATAPVITNVSVTETDETAGRVLIRWTRPFDIDPVQYPPPYQYAVLRSHQDEPWTRVGTDLLSDTVFTDTELNTDQIQYSYRILLLVPTMSSAPIDTSSAASTVRLVALSVRDGIELKWTAQTPWYNYSPHDPHHLVFRSESGEPGTFLLIDSVDVNDSDFGYTDMGRFQDRPLEMNKTYYYKVLTRGTYGNDKIVEPLENMSQVSGNTRLDTLRPCSPIVVLENTDCGTFPCTSGGYSNIITWDHPSEGCADDVVAYQVFSAPAGTDAFSLLGTVSDRNFQHTNLTSLAHCYRVAAVDAAGNISDLSEPVCNDNCPSFELPNVITPDGSSGFNDQLMAFGDESGSDRCVRFVKKVNLKIYNRWGIEVFNLQVDDPRQDQIYWNGMSRSGKPLEAGMYFYSASIQFDTVDPASRNKIVKGWIHLVRNK